MAFRRQDIPKTSRKQEQGGRVLFPRYLRDRAMLPSIQMAIEHLEATAGRRRGDCSPDALLDLFGDVKLARCLLACMNEHYRYRSLEFADVLGEESAMALLEWGLATPADLRGYLYLAVNDGHDGFAAGERRAAILTEIAGVLGVRTDQLDTMLHLDAERNAILTRRGPMPDPDDIMARYNAMLTISVLRHASEIDFAELSLPAETVEAICARHEVPVRRNASGAWFLAGKRSAAGFWSTFGARLARCATHLIVLADREPAGTATVHFGEQRFAFRLDRKSLGPLRPQRRTASAIDEIAACARLADRLGDHRRESGTLSGWTIRRWPEPVITAVGILLPELLFTIGDVEIPMVAVDREHEGTAAVMGERPWIALPEGAAIEPAAIAASLDEIAMRTPAAPTPLGMLDAELVARGWLADERLLRLLHEPKDLVTTAGALAADHRGEHIPGFGLCSLSLLNDLRGELSGGPIDVMAFRRKVIDRIGEVTGVDTLVVHLLSRGSMESIHLKAA